MKLVLKRQFTESSLPLKQMSRRVTFINTEDRISLLKPINQIQDIDEDIYQTSLIDRYAARPDQLNDMCLAEFAANYTTRSGQEQIVANVKVLN